MLTVIGDVHGKVDSYRKIVCKAEYSVQVGDLSLFGYDGLVDIDPAYHRFFGGNHEQYSTINECPNSLGDFGEFELGGVKFFFVRGAFSIDAALRSPMVDWWPQEELSLHQCYECLRLYQQIKPDLVLTHDCPTAICQIIGNPQVLVNYGFDPVTFTTNTQSLLQAMINYHKPSRWFFGHHHKSIKVKYHGIEFQCLNELETTTI